ncbi:hypothetical protein MYX75_03125 [Acidobacteria bacterium AH-259-A15]|nr:hypothetical protein [Acidobacteria bacterium AH-259-A15]
MRRATITIPDDLEAELKSYLELQETPPSLTSLMQVALRRYLQEKRLQEREFEAPKGPFRITPTREGGGKHDVSARHDPYLAGKR